MTYTEFIIEIENNIAKANCNKLNIGKYEEKQKQIYKQIRADAIDDLTERLKDYFVISHDVRVIEMTAEQLKEQNK